MSSEMWLATVGSAQIGWVNSPPYIFGDEALVKAVSDYMLRTSEPLTFCPVGPVFPMDESNSDSVALVVQRLFPAAKGLPTIDVIGGPDGSPDAVS